MISNYLYFPVVRRKGELSQNLIPLMIFSFFPLCDSEAIRTLDPRLRRALLYPAELRNRPLICEKRVCSRFSTAKIVCFLVCAKDFRAFFAFDAKRCAENGRLALRIALAVQLHHSFMSLMSLFNDGTTISLRWSSM